MSEPLLTVKEFLQRVPISRRRLQKYLDDGELSCIRLANRLYWKESDITEFLDRLHVQASKSAK